MTPRCGGPRLRRLLVPLAAGAILAALTLNGCAGAVEGFEPAPTAPPPVNSPQEPTTIDLIVLGDSLASGGPWDAVPSDPGSWTYYLGDAIEVVGGWRRDGATSRLILSSLSPEHGDALVVMAGTNDIRQGITASETVANVDAMIAAMMVDGVVLAAVPPQTGRTDDVRAVNGALALLATQRGWLWIDPWAALRDEDEWRQGASPDGIHGSEDSYRIAAADITDAVTSLATAADTAMHEASSTD